MLSAVGTVNRVHDKSAPYGVRGSSLMCMIALFYIFHVNHLRSESGGLWLHLDSTATQRTWKGALLWLHGPMHQG
jgi:hypothetical protein